jgi:uncharacterized membrane protein
LFVAASIAYPFLILGGLVVFKAPPRILALTLVAVLVLNLLANSRDARKPGFARTRFWAVTGLLTALVALVLATDSAGLIKLYPVIINLFLLGGFAWTLLKPPTMIFQFATRMDKTIIGSPDEERVCGYCRTVTMVWCGFFAINSAVAAATAFYASDLAWSLYNGLISYALIGVLFLGEMVVRHFFNKHKKA